MQLEIGVARLELGELGLRFLHAVLAEHTLAGAQQFLDAVGAMRLGHRDQGDGGGVTRRGVRGRGDAGLHLGERGAHVGPSPLIARIASMRSRPRRASALLG